MDTLQQSWSTLRSDGLLSVLVLVLVLLLLADLFGVFNFGSLNVWEGASDEPELRYGPSANQSINNQELDGANMGRGSNADARDKANAPPPRAPGHYVSQLARGSQAAHLRWCGVKDIGRYKAKGYMMGKNPQGWVLNTNYEGEPSLRSVGTGREGARAIPDPLAHMQNVGL